METKEGEGEAERRDEKDGMTYRPIKLRLLCANIVFVTR